jgi:hypothetical protein
MFFLLKASKMDTAHVVPVILLKKPGDCPEPSMNPQVDPEVAN